VLAALARAVVLQAAVPFHGLDPARSLSSTDFPQLVPTSPSIGLKLSHPAGQAGSGSLAQTATFALAI